MTLHASSKFSADEFFLFLRILALIETGLDQSQIADHLKLGQSTVSEFLSRVEKEIPERKLFTRSAGAHGGTKLLPAGKKLLSQLQQTFWQLKTEKQRLRVSCSQSLLTNQIISPVFADILSVDSGNPINFSVHFEIAEHFVELLRRLYDREIELAIVWGAPQRLKQRRLSGVRITPLKEQFDLVFISSDADLVERINSLLAVIPGATSHGHDLTDAQVRQSISDTLRQCLDRSRIAMIAREAQPLYECFPDPDSLEGHDVLQLDTYDLVIAAVQAKLADIAIVPAIYPTLLMRRELGEFFFSNCIGRIPVLTITGPSTPQGDSFNSLIDKLNTRLVQIVRRPSDFESMLPVTQFDEHLDKYRTLRYSYYIDGQRKGRHSPAMPPYSWRWETLEWISRDQNTLIGRIINVEGNTFDLRAEKLPAAFVVSATERGEWDEVRSSPNFVSTFTLLTRRPFRLFGTWTTASGSKSTNVYATILSEDRLMPKDLSIIQEAAKYRTFVSSENYVRFDEQPTAE